MQEVASSILASPLPFLLSWGKKKKEAKKYPRNRSRTSDLEISVVAIYSLPLCQLSYTRIVEDPWEQPDLYWCLMKVGTKKKMVQSWPSG